MTLPFLRVLAISLLAAALLPAAPALAGWRDGYYFADEGGYYPRPPAPVYSEDGYQGYRGGYDGEPRYGAYGPGYDEAPDYAPIPSRPHRPRPPRNVEASLPGHFYAVPVRPRAALSPNILPRKPKVVVAQPVNRPVVAQAPSLPVARPNLESMDFDSAAPVAPQATIPNQAP